MLMSCTVDWEKTYQIIDAKLNGKTYRKYFSKMFDLSERQTENKLSSRHNSVPNIEELAVLAKYLRCDIMDLLVFCQEEYCAPEEQAKYSRKEVEHKTYEDIADSIAFSEKIQETERIRNVYELLLYLPLIENESLMDVVFRCYGNLGHERRQYVMSQLSYLHRSIPDSLAKKHADEYRDKVLRVKGEPNEPLSEETMNAYWDRLMEYRGLTQARERFLNEIMDPKKRELVLT